MDQEIEEIEKGFKLTLYQDGSLLMKEDWGVRNLAYSIKRKRKGRYILFHFDATKEAMARLEKKMDLNENILRYLSLCVKRVPEENSAMVADKDG
jgi:small subunit ribosomal protein S6